MSAILRLVTLEDGTAVVLMDGAKTDLVRFQFQERGPQPFSPRELHIMNSHHQLSHVLGGWRLPVEN